MLVVCADCSDHFELSKRNVREHERRGQAHRCPLCRGIRKGPTPAMVEKAKAFWLSRYTLEELQAWPHL